MLVITLNQVLKFQSLFPLRIFFFLKQLPRSLPVIVCTSQTLPFLRCRPPFSPSSFVICVSAILMLFIDLSLSYEISPKRSRCFKFSLLRPRSRNVLKSFWPGLLKGTILPVRLTAWPKTLQFPTQIQFRGRFLPESWHSCPILSEVSRLRAASTYSLSPQPLCFLRSTSTLLRRLSIFP